MEIIVIGLLILVSVTAVVFWRKSETDWRGKYDTVQQEKVEAREAMKEAETKETAIEKQWQQANTEMKQLREQSNTDSARIAELQETLEQERKQNNEKLSLLDDAKNQMSNQFKNLAQEILDVKSQKFESDSQKLLTPLREEIENFRNRINDIHTKETSARASLKTQFETQMTELKQSNIKISDEANNLAHALKNDKKMQGDWGEIALEKLLEDSGLRKGEEYQSQESVRDENGNTVRPDVIIRLPDGKHLIVDSKVSLVAYSQYVVAEDKNPINNALAKHVEAIKTHVKTLSEKHYQNAQGINSPDFVFMFMPIEPAYFAALSADKKLFSDAYNKKIILVAPTTLMATLRTVERIWRLERQNKNAAEIANRAGKIHDKLCGFVGDLEKIGKELKNAQDAYTDATNKLYDGNGNLIGQAETLKALGADAKKELPAEKPHIGE